ncbi:hypothetical protein IAU60_004364 [Kwoniella sp. DSM 27419]
MPTHTRLICIMLVATAFAIFLYNCLASPAALAKLCHATDGMTISDIVAIVQLCLEACKFCYTTFMG